ncbi:MAG: response regulator [Nitrospirae bacterium]|nr:MAG: response regulator [Nitrospirota bacterium]
MLKGLTFPVTPSVLIVDDILSNLELIEAVIKGEGYHVLKATNARDAISIFEHQQPDIAVLDIMMPEMDGYQLCQTLKDMAGKRYFPIILLTALNDKESRLKGIECGADDFISKPFEPKAFLAKLKSLLRIKFLYDELDHSENIILTLAVALEARDPYTRGHSTRVGDLSREFAEYIGLSSYDQDMIRKAGLLHDIGKIGLSESLLLKPDRLTQEEHDIIKRHPIIGEEICKPLNSLQLILPAIRHHHERWDGKGFPDGLKADEIPLYARILAIVDAFDAMLSERPYRKGLSFDRVLNTFVQERDYGQWDPALVDNFIEMLRVLGEEYMLSNRYSYSVER